MTDHQYMDLDEATRLAIRLSNEGRLPDPYSREYRSEIAKLRDEYLRERDGKE